MKRTLSIIGCLIVCLLMLTACGTSTENGNTYMLYSITSGDETLDHDMLAEAGYDEALLVLNDDGTCTLSLFGEVSEGTWTKDSITLNGVTDGLDLDGDTATLITVDGSMVFKKG